MSEVNKNNLNIKKKIKILDNLSDNVAPWNYVSEIPRGTGYIAPWFRGAQVEGSNKSLIPNISNIQNLWYWTNRSLIPNISNIQYLNLRYWTNKPLIPNISNIKYPKSPLLDQ